MASLLPNLGRFSEASVFMITFKFFIAFLVVFFANLGCLNASIRMGLITSDVFLGERELARRMKIAHEIFINNFTMEQQLLELQAMHEKVMDKKIHTKHKKKKCHCNH